MAPQTSNVIAFPAAAAGPAIADAAARAEALDTHRSFIVEAPAGSGKTGLLVQRLLKLLGDDAVESPEEVLAVTFTRKATAELRERVLRLLQQAQCGGPLPAEATAADRLGRELAVAALERSERLQWGLLEQPARLNIQTFDAVSMQIANALPVLSGSGGQRRPLEDARPLYGLAAHRTVLQLGGADRQLHDALHTVLLHRDANLGDCERLIAEMLATREQWGSLVPLGRRLEDDALDEAVRPALERALEAVVCAGLRRALEAMPADALEELTAFAHRHSDALGYDGGESPIACCAGRHEPPQAEAAHLDHWRALIDLLLTQAGGWRASFNVNQVGFALAKDDKAVLKEMIARMRSEDLQEVLCAVRELPPAAYPEEQWRVTKALFHVLRHALVELKLLFAARGECDFTEMALAAREALRADPGASALALAPGSQLRHLLIDEMQDTSAGQYDLIERLTESWDGHSQTLFLVGDPKQSIYLFRAARVERFLRTMREERLGALPLRPLRLTANFRSQPALVADFNAAFSLLFPRMEAAGAGDADHRVPFVHAAAARSATHPAGAKWHGELLEEGPGAGAAGAAGQQARAIRGLIEQRLQMPLPEGRARPWRIAVLGRTRNHLQPVIAELKSCGLAFKAINLDPLAERPEVLDALALTRALLHPADRVAWLAVLHAPWCGLGLADLLTLTGGAGGLDATGRQAAEGGARTDRLAMATLVEAHRRLLGPAAQRLLGRAWPVLEAAVAGLGRTPLSVHVERTWRSLGGDASLTADQVTNVLRFLGVLRELEAEDGRVDPTVLRARLVDLYAEPAAGEPPVELLTIHKAKGLEWDLVIVPALEGGSGSTAHPLLNWLEFDTADEDEASILLAPIQGRGQQSGRLSQWLTGLRTRRERAEARRLFYVACTRAQEELHLFATVKRRGDGVSHGAPSSLLNACWPAAQPHLEALLNVDALLGGESRGGPVVVRPFVEVGVEHGYPDLALAAAGDEAAAGAPVLERLPLGFDPRARFQTDPALRLEYPSAAALRHSQAYDRPEGGFGVRAFGNVVHRYLHLLAVRLATGVDADELGAELSAWRPRLEASLRGEGLPPGVAAREAGRALRALQQALADPVGGWLLGPRREAASERSLRVAGAGGLRVDRSFRAGETPLAEGEGWLWIVDFKTTEAGSRSQDEFRAAEIAKYSAQLEAYAALHRTLPQGHLPVRLGLYYPLVPVLLDWPSVGEGLRSGLSHP
jgi:ATP-dependent exoDNAse (exonuclease V) beta subunit